MDPIQIRPQRMKIILVPSKIDLMIACFFSFCKVQFACYSQRNELRSV